MADLDSVFVSLKKAQGFLGLSDRKDKDDALASVIDAIDAARAGIIQANILDVDAARKASVKEALIDRLLLNDARIDSIMEGIATVIKQDDPVGKVLSGWTLSNGLVVERCTVPLGTVAIIYESRPNVTADAFCLAYKAGCSILLRGSSAALNSNKAIVDAIKKGLAAGNGYPDAVALAVSGKHEEVDTILNAQGYIDVVIPRGGHELIRRVVDNARVPVIETGEGNCHIYVDTDADIPSALSIIDNAKTQRPGVCNAVETLLVHKDAAEALLPQLARNFAGRVELRCCQRSKQYILDGCQGTAPETLILHDAVDSDWETEFLDYILAIKVVDTLNEAIEHINRYGTKHSESILSNTLSSVREFQRRVDAACVYDNASTRFTDGEVFGFGAELGISTQKFHVRGPMGLDALTTIKYRISGSGQIRG